MPTKTKAELAVDAIEHVESLRQRIEELESQIAAKGKQEWISETKLERINMAINTAVNIVNMSDDEHIQTMGAHIADQLISILPSTQEHQAND